MLLNDADKGLIIIEDDEPVGTVLKKPEHTVQHARYPQRQV